MHADRATFAVETLPGVGTVRRVVALGDGDFSQAWLINDEWVCRVAKHEKASRSLRREACVLATAAPRLPLPVPRPHYHPPTMDRPSALATHRLIAGELLTRQAFLALDAVDQARCAAQLAEFLTALHAVDRHTFAECRLETVHYARRYGAVRRCVDRYVTPKLDDATRAYVRDVFDRFLTRGATDLVSDTLVHGDFRPKHILWDPRRRTVTGVIDFGDIEIGDRAWDLVRLWEDYGPELLRLFLDRFAGADREPLVRRMYALYELDEIQWVAEVCAGVRDADPSVACAGIASLRELARRDAWRSLL